MNPTFKPKRAGGGYNEGTPVALPPKLEPTYGNKHTSLATTGYIWITNTGTNAIERTDTTTLATVSYPTGGVTPSGIAFDGTHLYITCFGSSTIVKMTTAGAIVASASIGSGLHQVIFDGDFLWATSYWSGEVYQIRPSNLAVTDSYTLGHFPLNLTFDGTHVWVAGFDFTTYANGTGIVAKFNLDVSLNATYTVGTNPYGIAFDGTYIWVGAFLTGNIYKVDKTSGTILATYNTVVANSTITGFSYFNYAGGILIVTVSKDYSPYNLPDNYNKSHVFSVADGSLQQLENLGIDPRNGSVDGFNFVYTAGYGDGSVTRYALFATAPVEHPIYAPLPYFSLTTDTNAYFGRYDELGGITGVNLTTFTTFSIGSSLDYPTTMTKDAAGFWVCVQGWVNGGGTVGMYLVTDEGAGTIARQSISGLADRTLAHTSDGTSIWVATMTPAVYKVNPSTLSIIASVAIDGNPYSIISASNGFIYVVTATSVFKLASNCTVEAQSAVPNGTRIAFDGTYIWISCNTTNLLKKLSASDCSLISSYSYTAAVHDVFYLSESSKLFVLIADGRLLEINPADGSTVNTTTVSSGQLGFMSAYGNAVTIPETAANNVLIIINP